MSTFRVLTVKIRSLEGPADDADDADMPRVALQYQRVALCRDECDGEYGDDEGRDGPIITHASCYGNGRNLRFRNLFKVL